jgi:hypothetical protein
MYAVTGVAGLVASVVTGRMDSEDREVRFSVTAPAWMGRAFAVSMSLNFIGMPLGSAIAGPVVQHSIPIAFAALVDVIAGVAAVLMLRPSRTGRARRGGGSDGGNAGVQPGAAVTVGG